MWGGSSKRGGSSKPEKEGGWREDGALAARRRGRRAARRQARVAGSAVAGRLWAACSDVEREEEEDAWEKSTHAKKFFQAANNLPLLLVN